MDAIEINITGRFARDPERRVAASSGRQWLRLAVVSDGNWISTAVFDPELIDAGDRLEKGQRVKIAGRLTVREYEKNGMPHVGLNVVARSIETIDSAVYSRPAARKDNKEDGKQLDLLAPTDIKRARQSAETVAFERAHGADAPLPL